MAAEAISQNHELPDPIFSQILHSEGFYVIPAKTSHNLAEENKSHSEIRRQKPQKSLHDERKVEYLARVRDQDEASIFAVLQLALFIYFVVFEVSRDYKIELGVRK